jgi:hypothetical protein
MNQIDGQEIIMKGRTPNMTGDSIALFLTFDGRWFRVRTRFSTFTKTTNRQKAELSYNQSLAA